MARAVALLSLSIVLVGVVAAVKTKKAEESNSLPETIRQSVEQAKTFLRNRKSADAVFNQKRGWERDEIEELFEHSERGHFNRGHGHRVRIGYPRRGHVRLSGSSLLRARLGSRRRHRYRHRSRRPYYK